MHTSSGSQQHLRSTGGSSLYRLVYGLWFVVWSVLCDPLAQSMISDQRSRVGDGWRWVGGWRTSACGTDRRLKMAGFHKIPIQRLWLPCLITTNHYDHQNLCLPLCPWPPLLSHLSPLLCCLAGCEVPMGYKLYNIHITQMVYSISIFPVSRGSIENWEWRKGVNNFLFIYTNTHMREPSEVSSQTKIKKKEEEKHVGWRS
jgi:hypothetical protein